jgi:hypothetical protein
VEEVSTTMLTTKCIWRGTTKGKHTNVKPVGKNLQRRNICYITGKSMILRGIAFLVKHVENVSPVEFISELTDVFTRVRNLLCVMYVVKHSILQNISVFTNAPTQV